MAQPVVLPRLSLGEGTIDPDIRIAESKITVEQVDGFCEALAGNALYKKIDATVIPVQCVDGRDAVTRGPNAAGGTFSAVMGDALTFNTFRKDGEKAATHAFNVYRHFKSLSQRVGGHDDDHAVGSASGCGAEDRLDSSDPNQPSILRYISRRGDEIRDALTNLRITADNSLVGLEVADETHTLIMARSNELQAGHYASSGLELRQALVAIDGEDAVARLHGTHNEVVVVINTRAGETLDREAVRELYGEAIEAFNVDVTPLRRAADLLSNDPAEIDARFIASLYYNIATAAVLSGKSLRIVVR